MVERTRAYLMSRRDGKGGFMRNPRALDTFGRAPDNITNAYIVWAITESGKDDDVDQGARRAPRQAKTSKDPYFLALVANSLINRGAAGGRGRPARNRGRAQQKATAISMRSTPASLARAAATCRSRPPPWRVLGWLKANRPAKFNERSQKAVKWIGQQRGGYGGFGSTQSTILALKALIAYAKANKKTAEAGELSSDGDGKVVGGQAFPAGASEANVLERQGRRAELLKPGKNDVRVEITGKNVFPYTLTWSYQTLTPASADKCAVRLGTKLDRTRPSTKATPCA